MNLIEWDIAVFEYINNNMSNGFMDWLLPVWRSAYFWLPLYVFLLGFIGFNFGKKAYWFVMFIFLTASSSDLISSRVIKKTIKRLRPCNTEYVQTIERVPCGSGYSFTSNHAANHFAVATFLVMTLGQQIKQIRPWLWAWAGSIAFAQIYVGVHFPLDVLCGAMLGFILGRFWSLLYTHYYGHLLYQRETSYEH